MQVLDAHKFKTHPEGPDGKIWGITLQDDQDRVIYMEGGCWLKNGETHWHENADMTTYHHFRLVLNRKSLEWKEATRRNCDFGLADQIEGIVQAAMRFWKRKKEAIRDSKPSLSFMLAPEEVEDADEAAEKSESYRW